MAIIYWPHGQAVNWARSECQATGAREVPSFYISGMTNLRLPPARAAVLLALFAAVLTGAASAQTESPAPKAAPTAPVVVLPVALYNAQANVQEASDSARATLSTQVLTGKLQELLGPQLVAGPKVEAAASSPGRSPHHRQPAVQRHRRLRPSGGEFAQGSLGGHRQGQQDQQSHLALYRPADSRADRRDRAGRLHRAEGGARGDGSGRLPYLRRAGRPDRAPWRSGNQLPKPRRPSWGGR